MKRLFVALIGVVFFFVTPVRADHKDLDVFADPVLIETGFMAFLVPRFSLKTGVSIHIEALSKPSQSNGVVLKPADGTGLQALTGPEGAYTVIQANPDERAAGRFIEWLLSDIGQRTIGQFRIGEEQPYAGAVQEGALAKSAPLSGDVARGEGLAYANCGRCHVIGARNRMNGIGSTPSFSLLRSFDNWQDRFEAFYTLNPHPSFSQITGVTDPFDETLPPSISPLTLTQSELDDIVAYTASIEPANLGAPLVHQ